MFLFILFSNAGLRPLESSADESNLLRANDLEESDDDFCSAMMYTEGIGTCEFMNFRDFMNISRRKFQ